MQKKQLREVKLQVFRSSILIVSEYKIEIQIETNSKHAKDMF